MTQSKILTASLLIFLISFCWLGFLSDGLPIGDLDDWDHILAAQDSSWQSLTGHLALPWSKSKYWVGQFDLMDQVGQKRIFHSVVLKSISQIFGLTPQPFYLISKNLFFAGTTAILFALLLLLTQSIPISFAALLFFIFVPAHYAHALWISDAVTIVHFFVIAGILISYFLTQHLQNRKTTTSFWVLTFLLLLTGWLGIKTKAPALILPLIAGLYILKSWFQTRQNTRKVFILLLVLGIVMFQLIPIEHLGSSDSPDTYQPSNILRMLFLNYECGYENESVSAFFSLEKIWPVSIARTFGFFLLWLLLFAAGFYIWKRKTPGTDLFLKHPLAQFALIWLVLELVLMGLFPPEPRYFSGTFIPLTLLAARLVLCVFQRMKKPFKITFGLLLAAALIWTTLINLGHMTWLRLNIGRRSYYFLNTATAVYRDLFPAKTPPPKELGLYYSLKYKPSYYQGPRLEQALYHTDMWLGVWERTPDGNLKDFARYAKQGFRYYVSESADLFKSDPQVVLLTAIPGTHPSQLSRVEQMLYGLKRKKKPVMYLYKHSGL